MTDVYDLVVIGAGPGGYVGAIRAAQLGMKTLCIDKRETLGGTCLNVGCIPSKALLHTTQQFASTESSIKAGLFESKEFHLSFPQLMKRKEEIVKGLVDGVAGLFKKYQVNWAVGEAHLVSKNQVEITGGDGKHLIEAKQILLATGSEPVPLPFLPFDEKRILSSTGALSLKEVPKRLLVIGAGVIGVELASVYRRLGTEVIVVEMLEQICPAMDSLISKTLLQILKKQGIEVHLGVKVISGKVDKEGVALQVQSQGQEKTFHADAVLVAIGRHPYSKSLGLSDIGITVDAKGFVPVDDCFRTHVPTIFAIGDLIEGTMLAHRAFEEAIAVAEFLAGKQSKVNYMAIPNVIYTHPEVAAVGLTEAEAREAGLQVSIGSFSMRANSRARCTGETEGVIKVVGDERSGRLLGMHIIASNASEMIGEGVIAIERKATIAQIAYTAHAHPSQSEAIKEACLQALGHTLHL